MSSDWFKWTATHQMPMPPLKNGRLDLPTVTLFCADCYCINRVIPVLERCKAFCSFGAVKLLTSIPTDYPHRVEIPKLASHIAYSIFMLKRAHLYIDTPHFLIVQHDGWILNSDAWEKDWLQYGYMGPLFIQNDIRGENAVGSGGFSLRSKRLMQFVSDRTPDWDGTEEDAHRIQKRIGCYEDGVISLQLRESLKAAGFKFPTPHEAAKFSQGGRNDPEYYVKSPFGFHGNWANVRMELGVVDPPPFKA